MTSSEPYYAIDLNSDPTTQKRPPWPCGSGHKWRASYEICPDCIREAEEYEIREKLIAALDRLTAVLEQR